MMNIKDEGINEVKKIAELIKSRFDIDQIILFGSYANGNPDKNSDLDICVVMDTKDERKINILYEMDKSLYSKTFFPVDLILFKREEFLQNKDNKATLHYQVGHNGMKIA